MATLIHSKWCYKRLFIWLVNVNWWWWLNFIIKQSLCEFIIYRTSIRMLGEWEKCTTHHHQTTDEGESCCIMSAQDTLCRVTQKKEGLSNTNNTKLYWKISETPNTIRLNQKSIGLWLMVDGILCRFCRK